MLHQNSETFHFQRNPVKVKNMTSRKGKIVLMGSGELTATMVEVHKDQLNMFGALPKAVFLDTPAGFQLNVEQICRRAIDYFKNRVGYPLTIASFKSAQDSTAYEAESAYHQLREADFILMGPGSPTYAVRQLQATPIPDILIDKVRSGGCLVAASAAALTMGRMTLPVYEIYKVGQDLHWMQGMDILGALGFNLVVVPHWNNAEGGTHDTRFCFMGKVRFDHLAAMLPEDVAIIGIDEHTACIIDLETGEAGVRGIGSVLLRHGNREMIFEKGDRFSIDAFKGKLIDTERVQTPADNPQTQRMNTEGSNSRFWKTIHSLRESFLSGIEHYDAKTIVNALLELDRTLWRAQADLENEEFIIQGRETLRDLIVLLGPALKTRSADPAATLTPMIDELIGLRNTFRQKRQWAAADAVRTSLERIGLVIEDTPEGVRWRSVFSESNRP
jgi:cyanophycinase-like exopeptidase